MRSGTTAAVSNAIAPPMQYPVVPALRFVSVAACPSIHARNACASVRAVAGLSVPRRPISFLRVSGSLKSARSGAVGAFCTR